MGDEQGGRLEADSGAPPPEARALSAFRPRLRPGLRIFSDAVSTVVEDPVGAQRVILEPGLATLLGALEAGGASVQELLQPRGAADSLDQAPNQLAEQLPDQLPDQLPNQLAEQPRPGRARWRLRALLESLRRLGDAGLLVEPLPPGLGSTAAFASPFARKRDGLVRPLVTLARIGSLRAGWARWPAGFRLLTFATVAAGLYSLHAWSRSENEIFLYGVEPYAWVPLRVLAAVSLLFTSLWVWTTLAQLLQFGASARIEVALFAAALAPRVDERVPAVRGSHLLYLLGKASVFVVSWKALALLPLSPQLEHDLGVIAIALSFGLLNPYRQSAVTEFVERLAPPDSIRHLAPYLRNRALFSFFGERVKQGETFLLVYSSYAVAWSIALVDFASERISRDWPALAAALGSGSAVTAANALVVILLLAALLCTSLAPLARIAVVNLVHPFITPLLTAARDVALVLFARPASDPEAVAARLLGLPVFAGLGASSLRELVASARAVKLPAQVPLIVQGSAAEEVYVLLEGEIDVSQREASGLRRPLARLKAPIVFGEAALEPAARRQADVSTASPVRLLHIKGADARARWLDKLGPADRERLRARLLLQQFLARDGALAGLPTELGPALAELGTTRNVAARDVIVREGERGETLYLLLRGQAEAARAGGEVITLAQGAVFGEIALLRSGTRTATVTMVTEGTLLEIASEDFWRLVAAYPLVGIALEELAETRLAAGRS